MKPIVYLDFDLQIERAGDAYRAQVLNSPAGNASHVFTMPFAPFELENFLFRLGAQRQLVRGGPPLEQETAKQLGSRLFESVFSGDIRSCLQSSISTADQEGKGLRLRLRLNEAPDLIDIPWEYLYNEQLNRFYALSAETPLVRYLEMPERILPLALTPPLRALVMIASPKGYPTLDVEREWQKLRSAVSQLEAGGLLVLERLEHPTLSALLQQLSANDYHMLHFIGHGSFDEQSRSGALIMEDEDGQGISVSGEKLSMLLRDHRQSLRLVILNACEGGRAGGDDPFSGTAQRIIQQGIPAVIAMQFAITDEAAITFGHEFYTALARGLPVDAALAEARKGISAEAGGVEWGTPVLYMRAPDGRIFDVMHSWPPPPPPPTPVMPPSPPEPPFNIVVPLAKLEPPDGPMKPDSPLYIERAGDASAMELIREAGGKTITIQGPRQSGKSSLLMRLKRSAEEAGKRVAYLDFQEFDQAALADAETFFRQFCAWVSDELGLEDRSDELMSRPVGLIRRTSRYFEHHILAAATEPIVLAMDKVDTMAKTTFSSDFFGMLRSWYSARSENPLWCQLDIVLVTSVEPYRLIENLNQSPFNIGETFVLADFTPEQIADLNARHGSPVTPIDLPLLSGLLGGHPYLVRQALYLLAMQQISLAGLLANATVDGGPFEAHLSIYLKKLRTQKQLAQSMLQVIRGQACADESACNWLMHTGLARYERGRLVPRCHLYAKYFEEQLHGS